MTTEKFKRILEQWYKLEGTIREYVHLAQGIDLKEEDDYASFNDEILRILLEDYR